MVCKRVYLQARFYDGMAVMLVSARLVRDFMSVRLFFFYDFFGTTEL